MSNRMKIRKSTRNVWLKLDELYSNCVPPNECGYAAKLKDVDKTEKGFLTGFFPIELIPKESSLILILKR